MAMKSIFGFVTSILPFIGAIFAGFFGTYIAFYLRGTNARREQIARSLADFYSSAATAYYAAKDRDDLPRSPETQDHYLLLYKMFDQHYKEFLSSSTVLASLVPPALREEVLGIEDLWDELNEKGYEGVPAKAWFGALDALRYKILDSISWHRVTDPFFNLAKGRAR
jgi:hypothetical protein